MQTYPTKILGSSVPLSQRYTLALLDLDGVVYRGANPVENAAQGITLAHDDGMHIAYTTNNPSRYPDVVAEQIRSFGIDAHGSDVITSAMVSAAMLSKELHSGAKVLVIGKEHLKDELAQAGMIVVDNSDDHPDAVIQSWFPDLDWNLLAQASYAIENGAQYFVTNRDMTIPREQGNAPGNGALQLPVIAATGQEPIASAGKPEAAMYHQARHLFSPTDQMVETADCLPVGDRLDTDIEAANRGGYDSAVVLTGVADAYQIMTAKPILRPTFICADLLGLSCSQPDVTVNDSVFVCENAKAWISDGRVHLSIDNVEVYTDNSSSSTLHEYKHEGITSINALRACASAVWDYADHHDGVMENIALPRFAHNMREDAQ